MWGGDTRIPVKNQLGTPGLNSLSLGSDRTPSISVGGTNHWAKRGRATEHPRVSRPEGAWVFWAFWELGISVLRGCLAGLGNSGSLGVVTSQCAVLKLLSQGLHTGGFWGGAGRKPRIRGGPSQS